MSYFVRLTQRCLAVGLPYERDKSMLFSKYVVIPIVLVAIVAVAARTSHDAASGSDGLAPVTATQAAESRPQSGPTSKPWDAILGMSQLIERSPMWSADGPKTEADWGSIVRAALELQESDPRDVDAALILYMVRQCGTGEPQLMSDKLRKVSRSMLVLRVMFDIPNTAPPAEAFEDYLKEPFERGTVCGSIPIVGCGGKAAPAPAYSLPVDWNGGNPRITACPEYATHGSMTLYDPHFEYRYFRAHFPYRPGLAQWLSDRKISRIVD